jgi:Lar family restriction alleviation protein
MNDELKSCPFCGGTPEFSNTDERARLHCTGCGTEGGLFFYSQEECETGISDATEARAIAAWNRRAAASIPPKE